MSLLLSSFSETKALVAEKILIRLLLTIDQRQVEFRSVGQKRSRAGGWGSEFTENYLPAN
jgi:hypothetical protein